MKADVALHVWWQKKVPMAALAALVGQDVHEVEDALRSALDQIKDEGAQKQPVVTVAEATRRNMETIRQENAAAAMRRSPVRRKLGRESDVLNLTGYPESLKNPLSTSTRAAWDALLKPKTLAEVELETSLSNGAAFQALKSLREKGLAHKRDLDGKWERTTKE